MQGGQRSAQVVRDLGHHLAPLRILLAQGLDLGHDPLGHLLEGGGSWSTSSPAASGGRPAEERRTRAPLDSLPGSGPGLGVSRWKPLSRNSPMRAVSRCRRRVSRWNSSRPAARAKASPPAIAQALRRRK